MKTTEPKKGFDCVEFKRQAQARIYDRIKGLSPEQEIEYFTQAAARSPLGEWWQVIRQRAAQPPGRQK